jgi:F-type H+-transporting ATPase subunit epsilon
MRLQIVTPLTVEADLDGIASVRADDATGSFVILPHHADFITVLAISVVGWSTEGGEQGHIAVRGGILRVEDGELVQISTRQAISGTTLERLGSAVLDQLREEADTVGKTRIGSTRLHMGLIRQLDRYLKTRRGFFLPGRGRTFSLEEERAGLEEEADERWD